MNKEQIEKMALDIMKVSSLPLEISGAIATDLTEQGYRKEIQGEWIHSGTFGDMAKCSICGLIEHSLNEVYSRGTYNYCPNCGAKMRGE